MTQPMSQEREHIFKTIQLVCSDVAGVEAAEIRPIWSFFDDLGVGMDEFAEILSRVSIKFDIPTHLVKEHVADLTTINDLIDFIEEQTS